MGSCDLDLHLDGANFLYCSVFMAIFIFVESSHLEMSRFLLNAGSRLDYVVCVCDTNTEKGWLSWGTGRLAAGNQ